MTRIRHGARLVMRPASLLFYLLLLLGIKSSLADPQRGLKHYSKYDFGDGLFMVGNSYMSMNNLTGIITNILEHSSLSSSISGITLPLRTETWSLDGAKWKHYAFQLSPPNYFQPPDKFEDALKGKEFRWVVLQEQSQIPGLYQSKLFQNEWTDSVKAVQLLDSNIREFGNSGHNTQTILFQTWGRLRRTNIASQLHEIYDTFLSHQTLTAKGYKEYQRILSTPERHVLIAPVGYAFQAIYDSMVKEGLDPYQEGGRFANLYNTDGSHPSPQGSYLAASVFVGVLTGQDPSQFDWDYPLVPHDVQKHLREVAHATITNYCRSEYCNHKPIKQSVKTGELYDSSSYWMRFLLVVGMLLAWKKHSAGKKNNVYSSFPLDRGR